MKGTVVLVLAVLAGATAFADIRAVMPVAFEKEGVFLPLEKENSCYSSYTVADGERIIWFGIRKRQLVGKRVK